MTNTPSRHRRVARAFAAVLVLAAFATLGFPGCPSDDFKSDGTSNPTSMRMTNLWPNENGQFWNYDMRQNMFVYTPIDPLPPDQVPRAVTVDDAKHLLEQDVPTVGGEGHYSYGLDFAGDTTTASGVTAQNLHESSLIGPTILGSRARVDFRSDFLTRLAEARPDLRARIAARTGSPALLEMPKGGIARRPYFIHGYAWQKTSTFIGTYGDLDTTLAWKFLDSNIRLGHEFSHQLVPELADDIWLLGLVDREVKVDLPNGRSAKGLDVIYVIDYGVGYVTDAMGNPVGTYRAFDYGFVTYVPGIGPVHDYERVQGVIAKETTPGVAQMTLDLISTGIHPALVAPVAAR